MRKIVYFYIYYNNNCDCCENMLYDLVFFMRDFLSAEAQKGKYFEKNVRFPEKVTLEEKVEMAARLVPTKQQLAWRSWN